jgi:hypothetical protein
VLAATMRDARRQATVPSAGEASRRGLLGRIATALAAGTPVKVATRTRAG